MDDTPPTSPSNEKNADLVFQQSLRDRGFEPGESVHEYPLRFTKEDAIRSLIESTYSAPRTVLIESDDGAVRLPVVLTSATAQYVPFAAHTGDTPAGCYEQPDWRLEGWVVPSGFNPRQPPAHVRLFIPAPFDDTLLWQVIPIGITPDEEIRVISD